LEILEILGYLGLQGHRVQQDRLDKQELDLQDLRDRLVQRVTWAQQVQPDLVDLAGPLDQKEIQDR
jgi:hypothetical protein